MHGRGVCGKGGVCAAGGASMLCGVYMVGWAYMGGCGGHVWQLGGMHGRRGVHGGGVCRREGH